MKGYRVPGPHDITLQADANATSLTAFSVGATCPVCRRPGTLNPIPGFNDVKLRGAVLVGYRVCPNPRCRGFMLGVWYKESLIDTYPSQPIAFDKTNIPDQVWLCWWCSTT